MPITCKTRLRLSQRWVTVLIGFLGSFNALTMRVCLPVAINEMIVPLLRAQTVSHDTCPHSSEQPLHTNETHIHDLNNGRRFEWTEHTQGLILSSFYWGYFITNILGGVIADKFGGKHTLGLSTLSAAVLTCLTPISMKYGSSTALIIIQALIGLSEGSIFPALNTLMARWIPETERSWSGSWIISGSLIGSICGTALSGLIIEKFQSWETVFYSFGAFGVCSFFLNWAFCYNRPADNPFISEAERLYLEENLKHTHDDVPATPWRYILRSRPVWALVILNAGQSYGFFVMISSMPKYMSGVLRFSVQKTGYLSSISPLCAFVASIISSRVADIVIIKKFMSTSCVRKMAGTISVIGPALFLVFASYAGCDATLAVVFYTIGRTLFGLCSCSVMVNTLDLAPNYAGTLQGFVFGVSTLGGLLSPYIVGVLTPNQTVSEWRLVFWIVLVVAVVSCVLYVMVGKADVQKWNDPTFLRKTGETNESGIKEIAELLKPD